MLLGVTCAGRPRCGTFGGLPWRSRSPRPAVSGFVGHCTGRTGAAPNPALVQSSCAVREDFGGFARPARTPGASMIDVDIELEPVRGLLEQADQRCSRARTRTTGSGRPGSTRWTRRSTAGCARASWCCSAGRRASARPPWSLQVARNVVRSGRPALVFSFEHDARTLLVRLVALEAGEIGGIVAPGVNRIRATFEDADGRTGPVRSRLADTECGVEAVEAVEAYGDRLLLHRSTGTSTGLATITAAIEQVRERTGAVAAGGRRLPAEGARARRHRRVRAGHHGGGGPQGPRARPRRPGARRRRLRQGGPHRGPAAAGRQPARLLRAGLRGRHGAAAQRQVRRRGPPPPRLQHDQRRDVPELGGALGGEEPQRPRRASTWSSTSGSTSAGSTPPAGPSPSSWSTSGSSSSDTTTPPPPERWRRRRGRAGTTALRPRRSRRRCGSCSGPPGRPGPSSWRR